MNHNDPSGEIEKVREETRAFLRRGAYFYIVMVLTVILAAGSSILVTQILTSRSERKFCDAIMSVDDGWHRSPPTTDPGREQAKIYSDLRGRLGCPPYEGN